MTTWPSGVRGGGGRNSGLELRDAFDQIAIGMRTNQNESGWSDEPGYSQGRESRLLNIDRSVRERDGFDHSSLGLRREKADAVKRLRREEIADGRWLAVTSQMKEDGVRSRSMQVTLSDSPRQRVNSRLQRMI